MAQHQHGSTPVLHQGSAVRCQFTIDGAKKNLTGFVRHGIEGDPDKVLVDIITPPAVADENSDAENLLHTPITFGRVLQHGDEGEHATFRYANE